MRYILYAAVAMVAGAIAIGFWLQSIGVTPSEKLMAGTSAPLVLWPLVMPIFGALVAIAIAILNYKTIRQYWDADHIEKPDIRPAIAILFGPTLALLMQAYVGLDYFDLTTKTRMLTVVVILQLLFFIAMGNYAGALRPGSPGGFRTPWTVKSDKVWAKTHRFIGRGLFVASIAGFGALIFFAPKTVMYVHIGAIVSIKIAAFIFSYSFWREEKQRHAVQE